MFALFHSRGILALVNDLLNKRVIGVSNCAQYSLNNSGEVSLGQTDLFGSILNRYFRVSCA